VSLAVWVVAGVVGVWQPLRAVSHWSAALAHLDDEMLEEPEDEYSENPFPR